jgi:hypothetical protein
MSTAASWASSACNKFREVARITENPTTKLLAEGLSHLAEAIRGLDEKPRPSTPAGHVIPPGNSSDAHP